jgi:predicted AAA+ superfamily ATPase
MSDIKSAIIEREREILDIFDNENIINRELKLNRKEIGFGAANIITGPRRAGKSIFAFQLFKGEKFGYVNFEDERLKIDGRELNSILEAIYSIKGKTKNLVFDEIQNVNGWEQFVSRLIPSNRVVITGSNSKLMSKELGTFLTGRHIDHLLMPFSFRELLKYKNLRFSEEDVYLTEKKAVLKDTLGEFLIKGGFPLSYSKGKQYLVNLYSDIIEKDIINRYNIKYISKIRELIKYALSNFSGEITLNKLKNIFNLKGDHTVDNWLKYAEDAYLLFKLERFSFKLKERYIAPKKIYSIDTGLLNAIISESAESKGRLMENSVAIDLYTQKNYSDPDLELYYWKDHAGNEVDFLLKSKNTVKQLIQVTYASSNLDIKPRETKALLKAANELRCSNLLVITWDYEAEEKVKGRKIRFVPLWKWLLNI